MKYLYKPQQLFHIPFLLYFISFQQHKAVLSFTGKYFLTNNLIPPRIVKKYQKLKQKPD